LTGLKSNSEKIEECIKRTQELLFQGFNLPEIKTQLMSITDNKLGSTQFDEVVREAYKNLYKTIHRDREFLFQLHMNRYEDLYRRSITMTDRFGRALDATRNRDAMIYKGGIAMKILKQKEDLVGLHNNDTFIEIDNQITGVEDKETYQVRLGKMTMEEKIELLSLIKKSRAVPIEGDRQIILKKKTLNSNNEIVTETSKHFEGDAVDIKYEEMPDMVVDKMQEVRTEKDEEYLESPIIIDNVDRSIRPRELGELKGAIDTTLKEKFEKLIKRKK
jgi:hypothetical protein